MRDRLFQWIVTMAVVIGVPMAMAQTVFDLETTSGEQSYCKDIPLQTDGNSGWLSNPQLENSFHYLVINAGTVSLGTLFIDGSFFANQSPDYMTVESVENRRLTIHIIRGFLFFEHGEIRKILGFPAAGLIGSLDTLEQALSTAEAQAIAVEEWVIKLHWDLIHPFWHGTGARKIVVWTHEPGQHDALAPAFAGHGAQCEAPGVEVQLYRLEMST